MSLPADKTAWPEAAREDYEERAAILESEANLPPDHAEREAERLTRLLWDRP